MVATIALHLTHKELIWHVWRQLVLKQNTVDIPRIFKCFTESDQLIGNAITVGSELSDR